MTDHPFAPYPDGRRTGCVRCHWPDHAHPVPPEIAVRDMPRERAVLAAAIAGSALDPAALWSMSCHRALPGPVELEDRSLRREILEELSDALNYLVWEVAYVLEVRAADGNAVSASRIPSRLGAIRKLIEAWDVLHLP